MSCSDVNWVVPGANPCNQPSSPTNTVTLVGNTASAPVNITSLTVTEIIRLTFTTTSTGYAIFNGNATIKSTVSPQNNITFYFEVDGTLFHSAVNYDSISGSNHYTNLPLTCSGNLPAGTHNAIFYLITNAGTNDLQILSRNLNGIINIPN